MFKYFGDEAIEARLRGGLQGDRFFLKPHICKNEKRKERKKNRLYTKPYSKKIPVYTDTLETTENDVVPMPAGLVWRRTFTP